VEPPHYRATHSANCQLTGLTEFAHPTGAGDQPVPRLCPGGADRTLAAGCALQGLQVPTLIVHGTQDPQFPLDHATAMAAVIPGATLIRREGVGHERPPQLMGELADAIVAHTAAAAAAATGHKAGRR
jgi:pimeloyl-ACP methyl ester carboxylesterase